MGPRLNSEDHARPFRAQVTRSAKCVASGCGMRMQTHLADTLRLCTRDDPRGRWEWRVSDIGWATKD